MKKITFSFKSLLLAAGLLLGSANAWGVDYLTTYTGIVGATDNTSGFNTKGSKEMSLAAGDEYVITFVNYNKGASGTDYWENWAFCSNVFNCRADHGASNPYWGDATNVNYTGNSWSEIYSTIQQWLQAYNGVTVTVTVSRNAGGDGITISHTATTNAVDAIASQTYAGTFTATVNSATAINFYMTCEDSHQIITKVVYTDASGNTRYSFNASESAYVDSNNAGTNYNGASVTNLQINNTQYRNWNSGSDGSVKFNTGGKVSLYKFDLSTIKSLVNITGISFTVVGISSDSKATSPVWLLGYNPDWSASTITYNSGFTNNGNSETLTGTVSGLGSFQPLNDTGTYTVNGNGSGYTTMSASALTYVQSAIAADKDYVSFGLAVNLGRTAYLNTGADLTISCSASVVYEATFVETNSLNPTVTVYTDAGRTSPIEKNALEANTTYYYRAVLAGYNDYEGSFDVETSDPVVNFTMTAKPNYSYIVYAKSDDVTLTAIKSGTSYQDATIYYHYNQVLNYNGTLYQAAAISSGYKTSFVLDSDEKVVNHSYSQPATPITNIVFLAEGEDLFTRGTGSSADIRCSMGAGGYANSKTEFVTLPAGEYYLVISNRCGGDKTDVHKFYKGSDEDPFFSANGNGYNAERKSEIFTLTETTTLYFQGGGNNDLVDWIYIYGTPASVVKTSSVNLQGYKTFYNAGSNYEVDANTTIYKGSATPGTVTLTSVEGNIIPKNTPVVLKTTNTADYTITLAATTTEAEAGAFDGNDLQVATGVESGVYILAYTTDYGFGFYNFTGTLDAGDVYLAIPSSVKMFSVVVDGTVTGVEAPEVTEAEEEEILYNTSGVRVGKDYKGIVINQKGEKRLQK